jgi:hypothetical protein
MVSDQFKTSQEEINCTTKPHVKGNCLKSLVTGQVTPSVTSLACVTSLFQICTARCYWNPVFETLLNKVQIILVLLQIESCIIPLSSKVCWMNWNFARSELLLGYTSNVTSCTHLLPVLKVATSDIPSGLCLMGTQFICELEAWTVPTNRMMLGC